MLEVVEIVKDRRCMVLQAYRIAFSPSEISVCIKLAYLLTVLHNTNCPIVL